MERNIDKIKRLEKELGRYQKKVADQAKEEARLRGLLETAQKGVVQINRAMDAILAQTAITCGEIVTDEETGKEIGRRLSIPLFSTCDILRKYEVRARRDAEAGMYTVGVVPREATE